MGAFSNDDTVTKRSGWGVGLFLAVLTLWGLGGSAGLWGHGLAKWSVGLLYIAYDTWLIVYTTLTVRRMLPQRQSVEQRGSDATLRVAVLISARNEASVLPATLSALLAQPAADEIIVVDDGSKDATLELLQRDYAVQLTGQDQLAMSTRHPQLRVLPKANSGKADSLNVALRLTHADLVVTLDADTIVAPGAIAALRDGFAADPRLVAAGGVLAPRCVPGISGALFEWFQTFEYLRSFIARVAWMRAEALLLVSGAFAGYRRDALQKIGGFDRQSWVEDYELTHRLHRYAYEHGLAWRVGVLPGATASTDAPATLPSFLRQRRRWFAGFLQTLFRNRDMIGNRRYGPLGLLMLPVKVVDTLQPLAGLWAFALLIIFIVGRRAVVPWVLSAIALKLLVDFTFLFWGMTLYDRWIGRRASARRWLLAALAALTEPFCFQLMRHSGATLGWFAVLTRRFDWMPQRAVGERSPPHERDESVTIPTADLR